MSDPIVSDPRISYRNRCISSDCGTGSTEDAMVANFHRMTFDECRNIIAIDGRKVVGGSCVYRLAKEHSMSVTIVPALQAHRHH